MKLFSTTTQPGQLFKQNIANLFAVVAGVAVSVGLWNTLPSSQTRFHFQQQMGTDTLSGTFEAVDQNSDGVVELSEIKTFQAKWGEHSWNKDNLESFLWGQKTTQSYQDKQHQFNGLNLFARTQQNSQAQILQIQNRGIFSPTNNTQNLSVSGIEYGNNQAETVLFSNPNLKLEVTRERAQNNPDYMKISICLGLIGLLLSKPLIPNFAVTKKAIQA
ncbi:MAG: hypothetical protein WBA13_09605 [Microcoleaceae cyanobacterium]